MKRTWCLRSLLVLLYVLTIALAASPAHSGPFDKLKKKITDKGTQKADQAADKGIDKAAKAAEDAVTGSGKQGDAKPAPTGAAKPGSPNAASATASTSASTATPTSTSAATPTATPTATATAAPTATKTGQPDLTAVKADFIPGETTLFLDEFKDMLGDEPPPHWKVRGGKAELRTGEGVRQLTLTGRGLTITPNLTALPKNFTMEAEILFKRHDAVISWTFPKKDGTDAMFMRTAVQYDKLALYIKAGGERIADDVIPMNWDQPLQMALWSQDGRLRFYVNGARLVDVNQIELPELAAPRLGVDAEPTNDAQDRQVGFRRFRFAESAPDFGQVIMSNGRYVTHGILFNTDSDVLKPESAPVIKSVARALRANPDLNLLIEGHTDSLGVAAHNLDLSNRRAEAVKSVLVSQFEVDAGRLTCAGLGSTKPIASNRTESGRAQNRRVEFARK